MRVSSFIYWYTAEEPQVGNELEGHRDQWALVSSGWCDRKGVSGREHLVGGAQQIAEQTHTIYMHFDPALHERCRITIEDKVYQILSIVGGRNRYMTIMVKVKV